MAFLLPPLAPPKKRKGPYKICKGCGLYGTKGFTRALEWGEWYHKGCFSKVKFVSCSLCNTVLDWEDGEESIFDEDNTCCSKCHKDELERAERQRKNRKHKCIKQDCHRTAVEEVNRGHWFCGKHIPEDAYIVVFMGGKYIN
jgi:hypothetical protein